MTHTCVSVSHTVHVHTDVYYVLVLPLTYPNTTATDIAFITTAKHVYKQIQTTI
jgi:hypothetical protein